MNEIIGKLIIILLLVGWACLLFIFASSINTDALSPNDYCKLNNGKSQFISNDNFSLIPNGKWYCLYDSEQSVKRVEVIYINYNWKEVILK